MAKEPLVIDLFFGEYFGGHTGEMERPDEYPERVKPKIRPMGTKGSEIFSRPKTFPYALDEEKNIEEYRTDAGFRVMILRPTKDIPGLTEEEFKRTIGYRMNEDLKDEISRLEGEIQEKEKLLGTVSKEADVLREEREELEKKEAAQSSSSSGIECPDCNSTNPKSRWKNNDGYCPSCSDVALEDAI
ncbi:hypothetical protein [Haloarcula litorea]|uniref:hypothetical protein n=1 Tax=Haloarcula litorea TaxID=3032579 RepID=UPI0023E80E9F|nr:hypothetical protein [Halomicroarcula sp. GDY20]